MICLFVYFLYRMCIYQTTHTSRTHLIMKHTVLLTNSFNIFKMINGIKIFLIKIVESNRLPLCTLVNKEVILGTKAGIPF